MPSSIVSLTASVADVRALRAVAFVPRVVAITLVVLVPVALSANADRTETWWMLASALGLWICAVLLERGVTIVAMAMTAVAAGGVGVGTLEVLRHARDPQLWADVGGLAVLCVLAWLATRAARACRRLARLGRRPHARASTLRKLAHLPRDARLVSSLGPFAGAFTIWAVGACAALLVAIAVPVGHGLFGGVALLPFALWAGRMFDSGRRRLALRLDEVRALDSRRPLLLLRSFADDNLPLERRFSMFGTLLQRPFTLEELMVDRLWSVGPVMAIGSPGETLRPAGAAREYVPDSAWQEHLLAGLDEAAGIVGILGSSEGVMWEFRQVAARGAADRFVLVLPPHDASTIVRRWQALSQVFPAAADAALPTDANVGLPLAALFPSRTSLVLYCCKYRNETAYGMVLDEILRQRLIVPGSRRGPARGSNEKARERSL